MSLPLPEFIARDPATIAREVLAEFEARSGRPLRAGQPERLLLQVFAYREALIRQAIQDAACQNLVLLARRPGLVNLGALVGVAELSSAAARTTIRFTLATVLSQPKIVPAGTRVRTRDGQVVFRTLDDLTIPAGQLVGSVTAEAEVTGLAGNGYAPGDVALLMVPQAGVASASNVTVSAGGIAEEDLEHLRQRILEAPEAFSVAGPEGAYRYHALSAHSSLVDVAVLSSAPGQVDLYPLGAEGIPTVEVLDLVAAAVDQKQVRPLTDLVVVHAPTVVEFAIEIQLTLYDTADTTTVLEEAVRRAGLYRDWVQAALGRDLVPSQLLAPLQTIPGVYRPVVVTPTLRVLAASEWASCTGISVDVVGYEHG